MDAGSVLKILQDFARKMYKVSLRAAQRLYQIYFKPIELFEEVRRDPDASSSGMLIVISFLIQTLIALVLLAEVYIRSPLGVTTDLISGFYSNLLPYVSIRVAALIATWFIFFAVFWLIMYLLGARIEGFIVFSATGYTLSSRFITFLITLFIYIVAVRASPQLTLVSIQGFYPKFHSLAAHLFRVQYAGHALGLPTQPQLLVDAVDYFGGLWSLLLTILMFKVVGELSWKKSILGGAAGALATWFIALIFRAAGML